MDCVWVTAVEKTDVEVVLLKDKVENNVKKKFSSAGSGRACGFSAGRLVSCLGIGSGMKCCDEKGSR